MSRTTRQRRGFQIQDVDYLTIRNLTLRNNRMFAMLLDSGTKRKHPGLRIENNVFSPGWYGWMFFIEGDLGARYEAPVVRGNVVPASDAHRALFPDNEFVPTLPAPAELARQDKVDEAKLAAALAGVAGAL